MAAGRSPEEAVVGGRQRALGQRQDVVENQIGAIPGFIDQANRLDLRVSLARPQLTRTRAGQPKPPLGAGTQAADLIPTARRRLCSPLAQR